jgi:hypothetical protein
MTYCQVADYTAGARDRPLSLLEKVKFPSVSNYLVAKRELLDAIRDASGPGADVASGSAREFVHASWMRGLSWLLTR